MPCNWAEMRLNQRTEREFSFYSRRLFVSHPVIFNTRYRGLGPTRRLAEIRGGSLEYFFTERYCLYAADTRGRVSRGDILHTPWPLQPAEAEFEQNEMTFQIGLRCPDTQPLLHFARYLHVIAWLPKPIDR